MLRLALLNHLLKQRTDLRAELARHAGQVICLRVLPLQLQGEISSDGLLLASQGPANATIELAASLLPRLALRDPAAERELVLSGDSQLAATVGRVLQSLDWDAEADLARLLGDMPAHRLASLARDWLGDPRQIGRNLAETTAEYLQEEARLLATGAAVRTFLADVDRLRDDTARLEKRLARLTLPARKD